jgi:hypothetical protein
MKIVPSRSKTIRRPRAWRPGVRDEEVANIGEGVAAVPAGTGERGRRDVVFSRLGLVIGEVDQPVFSKPWVQREILQTLQPEIEHLGHPGDRPRVDHAVPDDPKLAAPLGDQQAAIG